MKESNYEKTKKEGIETFQKDFPTPIKTIVQVDGDTEEIDLRDVFENILLSFAEKIKESVEKDIEEEMEKLHVKW